ncbi:hypothetical protein Pmani_037141 [Petrolisthes manimaculis]|uniref:Uncharacterized protein n=1 Tax=Petrolisthes manimaculis TaxID=1843537 RepID=A0AAE1TLG0_9EUCA|nr:hypothetical protein Pmani_037141 [Petrolisthes manimaculis]
MDDGLTGSKFDGDNRRAESASGRSGLAEGAGLSVSARGRRKVSGCGWLGPIERCWSYSKWRVSGLAE